MNQTNQSIGALWNKSSQRGMYMTGDIEINGQRMRIVVFPNASKKEDKHPDWRTLVAQPRPYESETKGVGEVGHQDPFPPEPEIDVDAIPF